MKLFLVFSLLVTTQAFSKPLLGQEAKASCNIDRNCTECMAKAKSNGCDFLDSDQKYKFPGVPVTNTNPNMKRNTIKK